MPAIVKRYWHSPGAMTAMSVLARALAMAAPLPFLYIYFEDSIVAFWLLIITFQSVVGGLNGVLPTISMQMLSYAQAGSARLTGTMEQHQATQQTGPNDNLKAHINHALVKTYTVLTAVWLLLAITGGTAVLWVSLTKLPKMEDGLYMWAIFIVASAARFKLQPYAAFLFALGETALARRLESLAWLAGTVLSLIALLLSSNIVLIMACLYVPVLFQFLLARRFALRSGWNANHNEDLIQDGESIFKTIWNKAWRGSLGVLTGVLTIYGGGFVFAQYATSIQLAGFLLALNLLGIFQQIAISPLFGSMPAMAASFARGDTNQLFVTADHVINRSSWILAILTVPVPIGLLIAQWFGIEIAFVGPITWLALVCAIFIVRYGATHLYLYTVSNELNLHIANSIFALLYFAGLLLIADPPMIYFPIVQGCAALVYASYARMMTWRHLKYPMRRDAKSIWLPLLVIIVGLGAQVAIIG
ncbi:hypothetical protein [Parasphingorhabdus sp.]|uniref:hypothetical protein n=1 Tax=Parasphingorhabdus sp. TaxID=2709688 RepID=UPI003D2D9059